MKRGRRRRQQIRSLFRRKRWHLRRQRSFGLAICLRSDTISWNRCPKRRFRIIPNPEAATLETLGQWPRYRFFVFTGVADKDIPLVHDLHLQCGRR
jgi:hypothetical protein